MVNRNWFALIGLLITISLASLFINLSTDPWQPRDCRPSDQVSCHYWESAPDGVYEVEHYEQDTSDGFVGFPNCPSCPTELHGEWIVRSDAGFTDTGTYEVTLIDNEITDARMIDCW